MSIAGDCTEGDLADVLLRVVRDASEDQHIRDQAAHALEQLIPNARLCDLIPLALGQVGSDPDDTIRGCGFRKLVPALWTVSQAVRAIRAPQNTQLYGSYSSFLKYHLPRYLTLADLPYVLGRMIRWTDCFDSLSWFEELAEAAFAMALKNLDDPWIRKLAVRIWVVKQKRYHPLPHSKESPVIELLEADENLRRKFVAAIINDPRTPSGGFHIVNSHHFSIFFPRDLQWALNQIAESPVERRQAWVNVIWYACQPDITSKCWDLLVIWQRIQSPRPASASTTAGRSLDAVRSENGKWTMTTCPAANVPMRPPPRHDSSPRRAPPRSAALRLALTELLRES